MSNISATILNVYEESVPEIEKILFRDLAVGQLFVFVDTDYGDSVYRKVSDSHSVDLADPEFTRHERYGRVLVTPVTATLTYTRMYK